METRKATVACPFCQTLNRVDLTRLEQHPKCGNCGKPILLDRPLAVADANFEQVTTDTTVPVVVDFLGMSLKPRMSKPSFPVRPRVPGFWPGANCSGRMPMPSRFER